MSMIILYLLCLNGVFGCVSTIVGSCIISTPTYESICLVLLLSDCCAAKLIRVWVGIVNVVVVFDTCVGVGVVTLALVFVFVC